ncbi:MAG TPA: ATP synthase subunit C [Firmicutes bacterium]|nr:ATP synthase subunit C [Bacillota bacterium]
MKTVLLFVAPLLVVSLLMAPLIPVYRGVTTGVKAKRSIICNLCAFFGLCLLMMILPIGGFVSAAAPEAAQAVVSMGQGLGYLAAALVTGMSCIGAAIAVAAAAPAAIGACSEDPKSFGKSIVFVGLGEGIGVYGLLISFMIITNL